MISKSRDRSARAISARETMAKFSVSVNVEEIVVGFEQVMSELSDRYLTFAILGVSGFLFGIFLASFCGALCAICCFQCCHRRRKRAKARKKQYQLTSIAIDKDI